MLIDLGSKSDFITAATWARLKRNRVKVSNQIKNPDKTFLAYASQTPLNIIGYLD